MNIEGVEKDVLIRTFYEKVLDNYQKFSISLVNIKQVKKWTSNFDDISIQQIVLIYSFLYLLHYKSLPAILKGFKISLVNYKE